MAFDREELEDRAKILGTLTTVHVALVFNQEEFSLLSDFQTQLGVLRGYKPTLPVTIEAMIEALLRARLLERKCEGN